MKKLLVVLVAALLVGAAWAIEMVIPVSDEGAYVGPGVLQQWRVNDTDTVGGIVETWTPTRDAAIVSIRYHTADDADSTATLLIQIDDATSAAYDYKILSEDVAGVTDLMVNYDPPIYIVKGTPVDISFEHPDDALHGVEIIYYDRG